MARLRIKALTDAANGQECTVMLDEICNGNPETTVAAHINMRGHGCMGGKTHDLHIAFACSACHAKIDGSNKYDLEVRVAALEGMQTTQDKLIDMGLIGV